MCIVLTTMIEWDVNVAVPSALRPSEGSDCTQTRNTPSDSFDPDPLSVLQCEQVGSSLLCGVAVCLPVQAADAWQLYVVYH